MAWPPTAADLLHRTVADLAQVADAEGSVSMTFVICSAALENALAPVSRLPHSKVIWPCAGRCISMLNHDRRSWSLPCRIIAYKCHHDQ